MPVQAAAVFLLSLIIYNAVIVWLENVHFMTMTGMFKSIQVEPWIADPGSAYLDHSNYLFFPLYGLLCRLLDELGIHEGIPWKQFAVLNAFWASVCVTLVFSFTYKITRDGRAASLTACFHAGTGFVLLLAVIDEDIMPAYTLMLAAMGLAALYFDKPTVLRVMSVAVLFTFAWLVEWRLIFPTLPALLLALGLVRRPLHVRVTLMGTLLLSILGSVLLVAFAWSGHNGAAGVLNLLWTGKGIDSGWGGISLHKGWLMLWGVSNYFLLTFAMNVDSWTEALVFIFSIILQISLLIAAVLVLWPRRSEARMRVLAAVFLGTFVVGEMFNLYSQPQDPQMQINVMLWLTVAWGTVTSALLFKYRVGRSPQRILLALTVFSFAPLAWNVMQLSLRRGADRAAILSLAALERQFPSQSTVFLYWGFENIATWQFALWSHTWDWNDNYQVSMAPSDEPRFKWIAITGGAIRHPSWSGEEHASSIKRDLDRALNSGYRVVISEAWTWTTDQLAFQLASLSAADHASAIHAMLHNGYQSELAFSDPTIGSFYTLQARGPR